MRRSDSESSRLAALRRYRILDTAPEPAFDEIARTAARLFGTPIALVSLVDESRQWLKASVGLALSQTHREFAFCARTIEGSDVMVVPDALADPRFARNPLVVGPPGIRFYAAAPLLTRDGHALGALCVIDTTPRPPLTAEASGALAALARVVVAELEIRLAAQQSVRWTERLERVNAAAIDLTRCADQGEMLEIAAHEALMLFDAEASRAAAASAAGERNAAPAVAVARADLLAQGFDAEAAPLIALLEEMSHRSSGVVRLDLAELDAQARARGHALPPTGQNAGWMTAPLRDSSNAPLGNLMVAGTEPFTPADEALLAQFAQLLAGALCNRILFERVQAAESRFRVLFQRNPNPMWVFDRETLRFLEVNDAAIELYGWSREEFREMTVLDLRASQDVPRLLEVLDDATESLRHHGEWRHVNRRGDTLHVLIAAYYGVDHDGRRAGVTVVHDITSHKRIEAELRQSQKLQAIGRLTGGIAHDFNNLLCVILGSSELIAEQAEDNLHLQRLASMTRSAADRGAALVERLLAFSRGQSLRPVVSDLNQVIGGMDGELRRVLGEAIQVRLALHPDPWRVCVDPEQLGMALLNLAINAREAMPDGGALIVETANVDIAGREGVPPGEYVSLTVTDHGAGMSEEVANRAFEPFFTTKDVGEGSGLGLSMVYGFIQQSRGHVSLASAPGSGTAVTILLPRAQARPAALTEPAARDLAISARAGRKTVVLVEGEKLLRDMLADQLAHLGYAVEPTQDGPAALALLRSPGAVDLLLTEMLMANGMTGQQLAEAARALRPGLPVLFMSSYGDVQESGPSDRPILLQKPFTTRALAAAIRAAFASRAA